MAKWWLLRIPVWSGRHHPAKRDRHSGNLPIETIKLFILKKLRLLLQFLHFQNKYDVFQGLRTIRDDCLSKIGWWSAAEDHPACSWDRTWVLVRGFLTLYLSGFVFVFVLLCLIVLLRTTLVAPPETGPKLSYIQGILIILGEPYALSFWSILESADKLKHWDTLWEHHIYFRRTTLPLIAVNLNKAFSRVLIILGEAAARQFSKVGIPASQKKLMPGNQGLVRTRFLIFFIFRYVVWFLLHSKVIFKSGISRLWKETNAGQSEAGKNALSDTQREDQKTSTPNEPFVGGENLSDFGDPKTRTDNHHLVFELW